MIDVTPTLNHPVYGNFHHDSKLWFKIEELCLSAEVAMSDKIKLLAKLEHEVIGENLAPQTEADVIAYIAEIRQMRG